MVDSRAAVAGVNKDAVAVAAAMEGSLTLVLAEDGHLEIAMSTRVAVQDTAEVAAMPSSLRLGVVAVEAVERVTLHIEGRVYGSIINISKELPISWYQGWGGIHRFAGGFGIRTYKALNSF